MMKLGLGPALLVLGVAGCARIGFDVPTTTTRVVHREDRVVPAGKANRGTVEQRGTRVEVEAFQPCVSRPFETVEAVETRERINETPGRDWVAAIAGPVLAGTGVGFLVDAGNVHASDTTSAGYNPWGPEVAYTIGGVLLAAGVGIGIIPIIDVAQAQGEETKVTRSVDVPARGPSRDAACPRPAPAEDVVALKGADGLDRVLGHTSSDGTLVVDLVQVLADQESVPAKANVLVGDVLVGEVDLSAVQEDIERRRAAKLAEAEKKAEQERLTAEKAATEKKEQAAKRAANEKLEAAAGLKLSSARAELDDPLSEKGKTVRLYFDVTVLKKQPKRTELRLHAACQVDDKRMVDYGLNDVDIPKLGVGDTSADSTVAFNLKPLIKPPSRCELTVMRRTTGAGTDGEPLHAYCFAPGKGTEEGPCPP